MMMMMMMMVMMVMMMMMDGADVGVADDGVVDDGDDDDGEYNGNATQYLDPDLLLLGRGQGQQGGGGQEVTFCSFFEMSPPSILAKNLLLSLYCTFFPGSHPFVLFSRKSEQELL